LPVNHQFGFIILLFVFPIILFSKIKYNKRKFNIILIIISLIIIKISIPSLKIQEGHNLVVLNDNSSDFYKEFLPNNVYDFFYDKFNYYRKGSRCDEKSNYCWKSFKPSLIYEKSISENSGYAFSSDWSVNKKKFSRIVNNINFSNLTSARIGIINNMDYNFFHPNQYDLPRENIPFFVMYEIPEQLVGSSLCWKGNIFWQQKNDKYKIIFNDQFKCERIFNNSVGNLIYGASLGSSTTLEVLNDLYDDSYTNINDDELKNFLNQNELVIKLKKSKKILIIENIEKILIIFIFFLILKSFFKFDRKLYSIFLIYTISFILLIFYLNKDLLQGFVIFTGGNDGLVYMSYGNQIFRSLLNFDYFEFFRGAESVFYFPSALRYFWFVNKIFFGETIFGYILIGYLYSIILYLIFKLLFGLKWSIFLLIIIFFTRAFEGYALSVINFIQHINQGDAEPLAIFFILNSLLIFIKTVKEKEIPKLNSIYFFYFGFALFLATSLRPNYFPTSMILFISMFLYILYKLNNYKFSIYTIVGFSFLLFIPFHNYYYGNVYVLFSSGAGHNTFAPISIYYASIFDLFNFNFDSANISRITHQMNNWIQPKEIHYIITFGVVIISLLQKNNIYIKTISLLALSQHLVCLIYMPNNRYAYLAWIFTLIINFYFIKKNVFEHIIEYKKF